MKNISKGVSIKVNKEDLHDNFLQPHDHFLQLVKVILWLIILYNVPGVCWNCYGDTSRIVERCIVNCQIKSALYVYLIKSNLRNMLPLAK